MEFWLPTVTYIGGGVVLFVISLAVVAVLKARHPNERNDAFLWAEAQRIGGALLVVALIAGLIFITLKYS
jgi:hypothetical protein